MGVRLEIGKFYRARDGQKVGPIRSDGGLPKYPFDAHGLDEAGTYCGTGKFYAEDGRADDGPDWDLIAEWSDTPDLTGPVRTVTRKEIQTGTFGKVQVQDVAERVGLMIDGYFDAPELRAAIATLTEIADALEGGA